MTNAAHVRLLHEDQVPPVVFDDFRRTIEADGFLLSIDTRPTSGPFAGLEWLMPTAAMLFITQGYFNGFLSEMGKDHYQALKTGLKGLCARFAKVTVTLVGTADKVSPDQPYSLVLSFWSEAKDGRTFKFLVPSDPEAIDAAVDGYLEFLDAHAAGDLPLVLTDALADTRAFGRVVLLAYDPDAKALGVIDPMTRSFTVQVRP